jgi:hypothetical protein
MILVVDEADIYTRRQVWQHVLTYLNEYCSVYDIPEALLVQPAPSVLQF